MADERTPRQRKLDEAEAAAVAGKPPPKQAPQPKPTSFMDNIYRAFGVKHNVNGKDQKKAPY